MRATAVWGMLIVSNVWLATGAAARNAPVAICGSLLLLISLLLIWTDLEWSRKEDQGDE